MPGKGVRIKMKRLTKRGFTLVEIMIVVAIIILLAAIAIPNLLRARLNANEAAAIAALRTIGTASESYRAAQTSPTYPSALTVLSGATPSYIDSVLGSGNKQGFTYAFTGATYQYNCTATPINPGVTGSRTFAIDETGVVTSGGTPVQ